MAPRLVLSRLTLLAALTLPACATERLEGPAQDLHELATPEPPPAVRPAPLPGPSVGPGRWRAWVPPQTTAAGDIVAGHWVDLTLAPPPVPAAPVAPMPRAPKPSNSAPRTPPAAGASAPTAPAAPAAGPTQPGGGAPAPATLGQPASGMPGAIPQAPTARMPKGLRSLMPVPTVPEEMR